MTDIYYTGIKLGKKGYLPGRNFDNRFSGGLKNGKSTFNLSTERRKNANILQCHPESIVIDDKFILNIIDSEGFKLRKENGIFLEFRKEDDKFKAIGIPLTDSGNSYIDEALPILSSGKDMGPVEYILFRLAKANKRPTKSLKENIELYVLKSSVVAYEDFFDEAFLNIPINKLYLYHSEITDFSLYHNIKKEKINDTMVDVMFYRILYTLEKEYIDKLYYKRNVSEIKKKINLLKSSNNTFGEKFSNSIVFIQEKLDELMTMRNALSTGGSCKEEVEFYQYIFGLLLQ